MITVKNGEITSQNTVNIGFDRFADVEFYFEDLTFGQSDVFSLELGDISGSGFSFLKEGFLTFARVNFTTLSSAVNTLSCTVKKNGSAIFSGIIIVTLQGAETDPLYTSASADLATKSYVASVISSAFTDDIASKIYVSSAVTSAVSGLASENYVSSAVNGLASESFVSSAVTSAVSGLASQSYVSSAVNGLASENYVTSSVSSAVNGLASQAFVTSAVSNGVSGLASENYVSSAISSAVGNIDAVLTQIIG